MTWGEIKLIALQKMFLQSGSTLEVNSNTTPYINAMPGAANEALNILTTANKPIIKSFDLSVSPDENLLTDKIGWDTYTFSGIETIYETSAGRAYYFETDDAGKVYVERLLNGTWEEKASYTISASSPKKFSPYKGVFTNDLLLPVRIRFSGTSIYHYRNIAIFSGPYASELAVPTYSQFVRYDLNNLLSDFYRIKDGDIAFTDENGYYRKTNNFFFENDHVIILPYSAKGSYRIHYLAYPTAITTSTADSYELPVSQEVAALIPLYIAAQLFKDDDISMATTFRNEFEAGRSELNADTTFGTSQFESGSGW